jgi:hypothetical protein
MPENSDGKAMVHAAVEISVSPNNTTAFMTLTPPENGGMDITYPKVMSAINDKRISYGVFNEEIKDAVDKKRYNENICVAKWLAPVDGVDGEVTYLYRTDNNIAPVQNERGEVDYKDLGLVRNITAGTTIATITKPTDGSAGKDITGRPVPQRKGVAAKITAGKGTSLVNDDTELIAAVDGNLTYSNGAFSVDEELTINEDVDVSSGNIDFIGSVSIRGNVCEGFKVSSKKNIVVNGSATNAILHADGDISVRIGAINSEITAKGNIKLGFCENCKIKSDGNVESVSFVGGEVFAGKNIHATGKGIMVGGKYTALENIEASIIGSESYAKTLITLGNNAVLSEEKEALTRQIAEMEDKYDQLGKILNTLTELAKVAKLSPEREQMKLDSVRNRLKIQQEIKRDNFRIKEIDDALELCQNLSVSCRKAVYPGVTLRINAYVMNVNAVNSHCKATIGDGEIVFKPL